MGRALSASWPLAILIGEGKAGASLLIRRFVSGIGDDASVARITEPCADAISGMRVIIHVIGFKSKDRSLADLENVFTMFLSSQKIDNRRTNVCIEAAGFEDVSQVFEFDAVTLIHELCAGILDAITTISSKSRELAKKQKKPPVTTEQVTKAADMLHLTPNVRLSDADTVMMKVIKVEPEQQGRSTGRLIVRTNGNPIQEQPVNRERILIGRDEVCDIRVPSNLVSRHHALLDISSEVSSWSTWAVPTVPSWMVVKSSNVILTIDK